MPTDHDISSNAHHSKKKRMEDDGLPPDVGQKPIQLQRRRVWRACESCRYVDQWHHPIFFDRPQFQPLVVKKLNAMGVNRLVPNALHQDHSVHGYRPKTELP